MNGAQIAAYGYDASERRVAKTLSSGTTHYIYDLSGRLIAEADGAAGATAIEYLWADDLPVALADSRTATAGLYFIHADHLNRPQKITDSTQAIVWDARYRPFGEVHAVTGLAANLLMFPGQFYDAETQLHQNWHRDYDPSTGRYIQSDPIGLAGGINTYAYVAGNPLTRFDPDGLRSRGRSQPQWGMPNYGGGPPIGSPENRAMVNDVEDVLKFLFKSPLLTAMEACNALAANDNDPANSTSASGVSGQEGDPLCKSKPPEIILMTYPDDYKGFDGRPGDTKKMCRYACPDGSQFTKIFVSKGRCPPSAPKSAIEGGWGGR